MTASTNMPVARACMLVAGLAGGAYCAGTAVMNGLSGAEGWAGYALGLSGGAVAFGSWFILPFATAVKREGDGFTALMMRLGWVMCTAFVLWNATGFTALHRTEKAGASEHKIAEYTRADRQLKSAEADLETAKKDARWASTGACTNATVEKSKAFCGQVAVIRSNISTAQYILQQGRPGSADAQAEAIGFVLQLNPALVAKLDPVLKALVQELAMSLFLFCAFRPSRRREGAQERPATVEVAVASAPDLTPLLELISEAQAAIAVAQADYDRAAEMVPFYQYEALLASAADLFVDDAIDDVIGYDAPVVAAAPEVAKVVPVKAVAKKAEPVVKKGRRMRDNHGRFAKKAKLAHVEPNPQPKPQLSAVPLGGMENVVILGTGPKKK